MGLLLVWANVGFNPNHRALILMHFCSEWDNLLYATSGYGYVRTVRVLPKDERVGLSATTGDKPPLQHEGWMWGSGATFCLVVLE